MAGETVDGRHSVARHAVADDPGNRASGAAERSTSDDRSLVDRLLDEEGDDRLLDWGWGEPSWNGSPAAAEPLHTTPPPPSAHERADHGTDGSVDRDAEPGLAGSGSGFDADGDHVRDDRAGVDLDGDLDGDRGADHLIDEPRPVDDTPTGDLPDAGADRAVAERIGRGADEEDGPAAGYDRNTRSETSTPGADPVSIFDDLFGPDRSAEHPRSADLGGSGGGRIDHHAVADSRPDDGTLNGSAVIGTAVNGALVNGAALNGTGPDRGSRTRGASNSGSSEEAMTYEGDRPPGERAADGGGDRDRPGRDPRDRLDWDQIDREQIDRDQIDRDRIGDRLGGERRDRERGDEDWIDGEGFDRDRGERDRLDPERLDGDRFDRSRYDRDRSEPAHFDEDRSDDGRFDHVGRGGEPGGTGLFDDDRYRVEPLGADLTEPAGHDATPHPGGGHPRERDPRPRAVRDAAPFDPRPGEQELGAVADAADRFDADRLDASRLDANRFDADPGNRDTSVGRVGPGAPGDPRSHPGSRPDRAAGPRASFSFAPDPDDVGPDPTAVLDIVAGGTRPPAAHSRTQPSDHELGSPSRLLEDYAARRRAAEEAAASAEAAAAAAAERASAAIAAAARAADEAEAAAEAAALAAEEAQTAAEAEARALADAGVQGEVSGGPGGAGREDAMPVDGPRDVDADPPTQAVPLVGPPPGAGPHPAPRRPAARPPRRIRPDGPGGPPPQRGRAAHRAAAPGDGADAEATAVLTGLPGLRGRPPTRGTEPAPASVPPEAPAEVTSVDRRRVDPVDRLDPGDVDEPEFPAPKGRGGAVGRLTSRPVLAAVGVAAVLAIAAVVATWTASGSEPEPDPAASMPAAVTAPVVTEVSPPPPVLDPEGEGAAAFLMALRDADIPTSRSGQAEIEAAAAICAQLDQGAGEAQLERSVPAVLPDVSRAEAGDVVAFAKKHYC